MLKKTTKTAIIKVRDFVQRLEENHSTERNHDQNDFAYPWLDSQLRKIVSEGGLTLRPHFVWGVLQSAHLAKAIGIDRISVIEFGVAGGNGLLSLEKAAQKVEPIFGIRIDVYGFDTGAGLPQPVDYRDLPNLWTETAFPMDFEKLNKRLTKAKLVLGLVGETITQFIRSKPAPVGFISFDLDYYTSTMDAFKLFEGDQAVLLPRIHCYFDDIMGFSFSQYNGERLAIEDFNAGHDMKKISPIYGLKYFLSPPYNQEVWPEMFYMAHIFDHPLYCRYDGMVRKFRGGGTDIIEK